MKTIAVLFFFSLMVPAWAAGTKITATVNGMVCAFCAQGITKAFQSEPAADRVDVNLEKHRVTLHLKPEGALEDALIRTKIQDTGFAVVDIQRE